MKKWGLLVGASAVLLVSCDLVQQKAPTADIELATAQKYATKNPIGRFQLAGKREYPNGSEIYVLDTQTGQVCYYFVASGRTLGKDSLSTDMRGCAGDALATPY